MPHLLYQADAHFHQSLVKVLRDINFSTTFFFTLCMLFIMSDFKRFLMDVVTQYCAIFLSHESPSPKVFYKDYNSVKIKNIIWSHPHSCFMSCYLNIYNVHINWIFTKHLFFKSFLIAILLQLSQFFPLRCPLPIPPPPLPQSIPTPLSMSMPMSVGHSYVFFV